MKIFISWSGVTSHKIALILHHWLPKVIETVQPWVSSKDIEKGRPWSSELFAEIENCSLGIVCVDPSNLTSPWLNFEAGALAKSVDDGCIFPLLFKLSPSDLRGPLGELQVTTFDKKEIFELLLVINKSVGTPTTKSKLAKLVNKSWPDLSKEIQNVLGIFSEKNQILLLLARSDEIINKGYLPFDFIRIHLNLPGSKLKNILEQLEKKNFVRKDKYGDWHINQAGTSFLMDKGYL
jgi:hypothetical protein